MNLPEPLLQLVVHLLRTPLFVQDLYAPRRSPVADLACVDRSFRDAVGRNPFRGTRGVIRIHIKVTSPQRLLTNLPREMSVELDRGTCVGGVLRPLLTQWKLPASFFSCDLDMYAPVGRTPIQLALAPHEGVLVVVYEYLAQPTRLSRVERNWVVDADRFYQTTQWILKLPVSDLATLRATLYALLPPCELHLIGTGPVMQFSAMPTF